MSDLVSAVKELRGALGDSQQAFANRLGMSLRAIANYEKDREPAGKALYKLQQLALTHGRSDLALTFSKALALEMEWGTDPVMPVWADAVREIIRNEKLCPGWHHIAELIVKELEHLVSAAKAGMTVEGLLTSQADNVALLEGHLIRTRVGLGVPTVRIVEALIDERRREHSDEGAEAALGEIVRQRPELYEKYLLEKAEAANGTGFEGSVADSELEKRKAKQSAAKLARRSKP